MITQNTPSGGTVKYGYNELSVKNEITNAREQVRKCFYDALGRITGYVGAEDSVSYTYDKCGNVLTVTDKNGTVTRTYDALHRVLSCTDTYGKTIRYAYDAVGNLDKITYPDNTVVNYAHDDNNNLVSVTDWAGRTTTYSYDQNNRLIGVVKPDGSVTETFYDNAGRVTSTIETKDDRILISNFYYEYDTVGRITCETDVAKERKIWYTYDGQSRVTKVTVTDMGDAVIAEQTFEYDWLTNITNANDCDCNQNFVYDGNNRLTSYNGYSISYDMDGNMLNTVVNERNIALAFDSANRLIKADGTEYTYTAEDVRIKAVTGDKVTTYTYNTNTRLSQLLTKTTNGVVTKYVYGLGLIGEECNYNFKTYHFDYRGSTTAITDENGKVIDTFKYDAYGNVIEHTGTSDTPFLFNGCDGVMTEQNGLIYMRARYYNPEIKRFINADILAGTIDNPPSLNRYAYAEGNPVSNVDPTGLFSVFIVPDAFLKSPKDVSYSSNFKNVNNDYSFVDLVTEHAINSAKAIGKRATIGDGEISISMISEEAEIQKISKILGLKKTCDLIAESACDKFYDENGREFMLSDECVSVEIFDHIEAYYWSVDKKVFPNLLAAGFIAKQSLQKVSNGNLKLALDYDAESVYAATKSIDMRESDIVKKSGFDFITSQANVFNYKDGLRDEYIGTEHDPWADERK